MSWLLVATGGALGALIRWKVMHRSRLAGATNAGATLLVNLVGSFLLGLVTGWASRPGSPEWLLPLLGGGVCGALTTFSSHALHVVQAAREGRLGHAAADVLLSLGLTVLALSLGWALTA